MPSTNARWCSARPARARASRCSAWPDWCARTQGRIEVGSRVLFDSAAGIDLPPQVRNVGHLVQDYALFPHMSVEENVAFGLKGRFGRRRTA